MVSQEQEQRHGRMLVKLTMNLVFSKFSQSSNHVHNIIHFFPPWYNIILNYFSC